MQELRKKIFFFHTAGVTGVATPLLSLYRSLWKLMAYAINILLGKSS